MKNKESTQTTLKCIKTNSGKYGLYSVALDGKLKRVSKIGLGTQPFEIVGQYPNRNLVVVKKYAKTPRGITPLLFLVNTQTGKIPDIMHDGVGEIMYDTEKQNFYFDSMLNTLDIAEYIKLRVMLLTAPNQQLNESRTPNMTVPRIQILTANMPGNAIQIVAQPPRRKKRPRKKTLKRARAKRINTIRTQQKSATLNTKRTVATKKPRRPGNAKSAMRAKFITPYSIRKNSRIKYHKTRINSGKTKAATIYTGLRPATMPIQMPISELMQQNQR